ncbi:hypothetical protein DI272_33705 [Streptomyces sp. Act143]|uniref:hypothetical protein n=1 Tax=Streptomyces sp. Act143 TaxID=2200760 RepID=UPI000D67630E|nr:hypothetical protein [Streptomyces sp. Act143]PWI18546.1 hypothetical protein DI272_33705 [Streptomyces sp. Act143]
MRADLPQILPDHPRNAALLAFLRAQGAAPSGPHDYALGEWQLHTHPDLMERLAALGLGAPLHAAHGVPLLARKGVAAVAATGTSRLLLRLPAAPTGLEPSTPVPALERDGWWAVDAWQSALSTVEGDHRLLTAVDQALAHALSLAGR